MQIVNTKFDKNIVYQMFIGFKRMCTCPKYTRQQNINPLNAELNHICNLLELLGAHPILHVSRIRVKQIRARCTTITIL